MSAHELALKLADQIPGPVRERMLCRKAIEIRPVDPVNPFAPDKREPVRYVWFKAIGRLPDDPVVHQSMLAYASDYGLVLTALYPHGKSFWQPRMQVASLDHAMWFHRAFRMDDWLLYAMESPNAGKARGFCLRPDFHPGRQTDRFRGPGRAYSLSSLNCILDSKD